jgi:hypothetical protein
VHSECRQSGLRGAVFDCDVMTNRHRTSRVTLCHTFWSLGTATSVTLPAPSSPSRYHIRRDRKDLATIVRILDKISSKVPETRIDRSPNHGLCIL